MSVSVTIPAETIIIPAKSASLKFRSILIKKDKEELFAVLTFMRIDANGMQAGADHVITLKGAEYNTFWNDFISGSFVYEQLSAIAGAPVVASDAMEAEFLNVIPAAPSA
jgi:hypothetical protein